VRLRLDANGAWPASTARAVLRSLAGMPVESVEEPLAEPEVPQLARLRAASPVPIALDESLAHLGDEAVVALRPVDRVVLKPMARGGLRRALHFVRRAEAAGLECVVTTTVDSAVGTLAAAHLAAALPQAGQLAHGLATSGWLARDVAAVPAVRGGCLRLASGPGLGVEPQSSSPASSSSTISS
jgi:L-alanine-DL-glutamate epimerase-like enolase superfamily enzyme